jgi:hypothetical protein
LAERREIFYAFGAQPSLPEKTAPRQAAPGDRIVTAHPRYERYIGVDYSGAQTPDCSLKGLRVYLAEGRAFPEEVPPPPSPRKYWTRRGLAEWLGDTLAEGQPTLVGLDHGFSFPLRYFEAHRLEPDWPGFLEDFHHHWPTDARHTYVDFIRDGKNGEGRLRLGSPRWRRMCEQRCGAKSVFHFDVPGSVAKSTFAGIPWLLYLRRKLGEDLHFWPFDGWQPPAGRSVIAEAYPSLWKDHFPREGRTPDQHDAYVVAASLQNADFSGTLPRWLQPDLDPGEALQAGVEGWILGVR